MSDTKTPWEVCFDTQPIVDDHGHIVTDPDGGPIHADQGKHEANPKSIRVMHDGVTLGRVNSADIAYTLDGTTLTLTIKNPRLTFLPKKG